MNILAHIYLSGNDSEIQIGNFIADEIKGSRYLVYPEKIARGIVLHRHIDSFADKHPSYSRLKKLLAPEYGHYAGIVVDIFFDHYLASHWNHFCEITLPVFARRFYVNLVLHTGTLPLHAKRMMPFMIARNWLVSYADVSKMELVLLRMSQRSSLPDKSAFALQILDLHYDEFLHEFMLFMPQVQAEAERHITSYPA